MPCYCYCNDAGLILAQQQLNQQNQAKQEETARREAARSRALQTTNRSPSIASQSSWRSRLSIFTRRTEPPPYGGEAPERPLGTALPHTIPLRSSPDDASQIDILARVFAVNFTEQGITRDAFTHFFNGLQKRASPSEQNELSTNLTVLQLDEQPLSAAATVPDLQTYLTLSNIELFHPVGLIVEVAGQAGILHGAAPSSALNVHRSMTMSKLYKLQEQMSKLSYTFDRELSAIDPDDTIEREEMKAVFDTKRNKLRTKAEDALAEYSTKIAPYSPSPSLLSVGPLALVVSQKTP